MDFALVTPTYVMFTISICMSEDGVGVPSII